MNIYEQGTCGDGCQVGYKKPDAYIDITVDMDELDLTASEAKATYQKIKDYILKSIM